EIVEYDMAYLNKYSPRPGTVSARKYPDDIAWEEKQRREKVLNEILIRTAGKHNQTLVGQTIRVLVDEATDQGNGLLLNSGKSDLFKTTQFESARSYVGQFVNVQVTKAEAFGLFGELV